MRLVWLTCVVALSWGCGGNDAAYEPSRPPTEPDELHAWLTGGDYLDWESESAVLPGTLGGGRRIFVDRRLADSLDQGSRVHPVGSSAVREIYEADLETLRGWSVIVKVEDIGDGHGWYFYETFDPIRPDSVNVAERGASGCTFCHADSPDFVRSEYPLP